MQLLFDFIMTWIVAILLTYCHNLHYVNIMLLLCNCRIGDSKLHRSEGTIESGEAGAITGEFNASMSQQENWQIIVVFINNVDLDNVWWHRFPRPGAKHTEDELCYLFPTMNQVFGLCLEAMSTHWLKAGCTKKYGNNGFRL